VTRRWSKPDSNSRSHPERQRSEGATWVPPLLPVSESRPAIEITSGLGSLFAGRAMRLGDPQRTMLSGTVLSILLICITPFFGGAFALLFAAQEAGRSDPPTNHRRPKSMSGSGYLKFRNDRAVPEIRIGVREFNCIGVSPPLDHPHVYNAVGPNRPS
jgi:uncharacterized Zn-finger protein